MSRRLEMRHNYPALPSRIREVLADRDYLQEKLRTVGGRDAELVSRTENGSGQVTVVQRQAVPDEALPSAVRSLISGDLRIERTEVWTGPTEGTIDVAVSSAPGSVSGTISVAPEGDGSLVVIAIDASIPVPLVGSKIEKTITDNIEKLGKVEHAFTLDWLSRHPA